MDNMFNFKLPEILIAQEPAKPRDHARLLVYNRSAKTIVDDYFYNLCDYLPPNTTVVANNTRVNHCRYLFDNGKTEIFVVEGVNDTTVRAMVRPGKKFKSGDTVQLVNDVRALVTNVDSDGIRTIQFNVVRDNPQLVEASHIPLPPYIVQNDTLAEEYQTIYAKREGSLAAPTAGLHFTPELRKKVHDKFGWEEITLDVGLGTFAPLKPENFADNKLHTEHYSVSKKTHEAIKNAHHVTAVGTTTLRTIESMFGKNMGLEGETDIFITPGYVFAKVDSLITNFHLPGTSLLLLVEAFLGSREELRIVYEHAIASKYRFYSFGDAMLIQ